MKIFVVPTRDGDMYFNAGTSRGKDKAIETAAYQVLSGWDRYSDEDRHQVSEAVATKMHFTLSEALFDVNAIRVAELVR